MKLRNKKTGEIVTIGKELSDDFDGVGLMLWFNHVEGSELDDYKIYDSLAELNEEWEDYKPTEPLIKDEKIRKAVIAWAKANSQQTSIAYKQLEEDISCLCFIDFGGLVIEFNKPIDGLTSGKIYKFTELCGKEKK